MRTWRRPRSRIGWRTAGRLLAATAAAVGLLAVTACSGSVDGQLIAHPSDGSQKVCSTVADESEVRTSSIAMVATAGTEPVSIVAWEPHDVDGVEVVGVSAAPASQIGGLSGLQGYPPHALPASEVTITELADQPYPVPGNPTTAEVDGSPSDTGVLVLVGVRLAAGRDDGSLGGLTLDTRDSSGAQGTLTIDSEVALTRGRCTLVG